MVFVDIKPSVLSFTIHTKVAKHVCLMVPPQQQAKEQFEEYAGFYNYQNSIIRIITLILAEKMWRLG